MQETLPVRLSVCLGAGRRHRPAPVVLPERLLGAHGAGLRGPQQREASGAGGWRLLKNRICARGLRDSGVTSAWPRRPHFPPLQPDWSLHLSGSWGAPHAPRLLLLLVPPPPGSMAGAAAMGPFHWGLCSSTEAGDVGDFLDPPPPPPALSARSSIRGCFLGTQILFYKLPRNGCYHRTIASQLLLCGLPPASGPRCPHEVAFLDHFLHSESSSPLSRSPPSW